jgi:cobalt-zinc-cadmium efflux system protein
MKENNSHTHHTHSASTKNIKVAFFLNLSFSIIEIIGGIFTNSVAILSDAVHDLGDSFSLGISWYFQKISGRKSNQQYSYGYKRFSLLGAIVNSVVLVTGSVLILSRAIPRIIEPQQPDARGMFLLAILGIIVNGAAVIKLRQGSSLNEKVAMLHLLEDVLGWLAVLVGSVVIHYFDVPVIDPLLSIAISIFVLYNVFKNIRQSMRIILQGTPHDIDTGEISNTLKNIDGVCDVHDLHIWSVDGEYNVLTVHVVLNDDTKPDLLVQIKQKIRASLQEKGIEHATIEFENKQESCSYIKC